VRSDQIWATAALVLLFLFVLPVVLQNAHILSAPWFGAPLTTGDDAGAVAVAMGRSRAQNVMVSLAVRSASGSGPRPFVYAPPVLESISALPKDQFFKWTQQTLQEGLLQPLIGGKLVKTLYATALTDAQVAKFEEQGRIERFPMDVWAVRPTAGESVSAVVLHTDASGKHIIVVPAGDSPAVRR
jgi:hypothetical protein